MKEQFCSYEIALKLKELGFNEPCLGGYYEEDFTKDIILLQKESCKNNQNIYGLFCSAPLWQQCEQWFREKHNLSIFVDMNCMEDIGYTFYIGNILTRETIYEEYNNTEYYEEAREEAILKAIELCQKEK